MFFSDDLLSSKKGSFGIIWLAATLGPKTKRITRKQLTGVDLTKTCELIAEPPEPLALRLSGCLLVGVARVYNQNYDLFYTDVTKFHSDLRRMVLTDFGAPTGPGGQPIGLDLVGDGKARIDQITFGGEDASWLSNFNPDFLNMRWLHPKYAARDRQASTQLSSLQSQQSQDGKGSLADDSDEETDESEGDDDDAEIPRRGKRKSRNNSSPGGKKMRMSKVLPSSDPGGDVPLPVMDVDLFPGVDFTQNGPDDSSLVEPNHPPTDFTIDFPQDPNIDINPDGQGQTASKAASEVPTGEDGGPGAQIPQQGSMASVEEVDGLVEPEKKKKKVKKTKKVKFDDDLEIEYDALRDANYVQRMTEERADMRTKERNKLVDERATALVDGGGGWTGFFDPEMEDLFSTISRPGKFQWESDHTVNGPKFYSRKAPEPEGQEQDDGRQNYEQEPYGPDITGQSAPFVDEFQDYEVPIGVDEPEMARRQSQSQRQRDPGEGTLPWANEAFADSDDFGPDNGFTPGSRLSNMTPLEKKIRQSSGRNSFAIRGRQERSPSVLGEKNLDPKQLVSDEDANDFNLDDENFDAGNLPASQMRRELPDAFQPHMLASLETQCRDFMAFTERKMFQEEKTELDFDEIIEDDSTKKVAALAFYNCLTLATKKILSVSQPTPWKSITLRFSADL